MVTKYECEDARRYDGAHAGMTAPSLPVIPMYLSMMILFPSVGVHTV